MDANVYASKLHPPITVREIHGEYRDDYNNVILGECKQCVIMLHGADNRIDCRGANITNSKIYLRSSDCAITLGKGCNVSGSTFHVNRPKAVVEFDEGVYMQVGILHIWNSAHMRVGRKSTFMYSFDFVVSSFSRLDIGADCMFSSYVKINVADDHAIFDVNTGENVNSNETNKQRHVVIGDHVWVGKDAFLLGNSEIGSGSIIGARSLVKGRFPNNCILAGNPARVIATDRAWAKVYGSTNIHDCGDAYIKATDLSGFDVSMKI